MRFIHVSVRQLPIGISLNGWRANADPGWNEIYGAIADADLLSSDLLRRWYADHRLVATLITEAVYERVREDEFPAKPSRLGSAYACGSPEAAMFFALKYRGANSWFYELGADVAWVADMTALNPSIELNSQPMEIALDRLRDRARAYWTGLTRSLDGAFPLPEILLPNRSTVIRELVPPFMK